MTKIDWNIWKIDEWNNALVTWAVTDVGRVTQRTASSVLNTVSPSALAVADNTLSLVSNPANFIKAENYGKLAKTVPAIPMDIMMKAFRLPFSRLDDALNYTINNNLERGTTAIKGLTTQFVANLLTNNGTRENKFMNALGTGVEGFGDLVTTIIKTPTGALAAGTSIIDKYLWQATNWTEWFVNSVRIQSPDKNFFSVKPITPTRDTPQAANDNRAPVSQAA